MYIMHVFFVFTRTLSKARPASRQRHHHKVTKVAEDLFEEQDGCLKQAALLMAYTKAYVESLFNLLCYLNGALAPTTMLHRLPCTNGPNRTCVIDRFWTDLEGKPCMCNTTHNVIPLSPLLRGTSRDSWAAFANALRLPGFVAVAATAAALCFRRSRKHNASVHDHVRGYARWSWTADCGRRGCLGCRHRPEVRCPLRRDRSPLRSVWVRHGLSLEHCWRVPGG